MYVRVRAKGCKLERGGCSGERHESGHNNKESGEKEGKEMSERGLTLCSAIWGKESSRKGAKGNMKVTRC